MAGGFQSHPLEEHELTRLPGRIPARALLEHPLIMTGRYHTDAILTHPFWHRLGQPPRIAFEVSQPQSLFELVRAELGVGVTTALAVHVSRIDDLVVRSIDDDMAIRDVCLYWPRSRALSIASQIVKTFMLEHASLPPSARAQSAG
ncbi:MAG TPA: LysR family transcriptional regulator substrate-binding protein [Devosia sp.]|nr:LysR family transcriptional regulator substrate-binding protein [Devosia sp.]